jgi:hypothetical protein
LLANREVDSLLEAAVAAPSADNHHHWRLKIAGAQLQLTTPGLAEENATRRQLSRISLGAVAESLVIAGTRHGLRLEVSEHPQSLELPLTLTVCRDASLQPDPLEASLALRHSNRTLRYRRPAWADGQWQALLAQVARVPGAFVAELDEPARRRQAVQLVERAERERFCNPALHADMYNGVRFDVGWHASSAEGLAPSVLGIAAWERPGFRAMANWRVQRLANLFGAHRMLGLRSAGLPARQAPHLLAIGATGAPELAALRAGRALLRLWCGATRLGTAAQVWAASPMYALPGASDIDPSLQRQLEDGWKALCPAGRPMIVLRLGMAPPPAARTGRPDAHQFLA